MTIKKSKRTRIKERTIHYLKVISIPGIPQIFATDNYLFKIFWSAALLICFGFGIYNIVLSVNDYYHFDVITNVKRITPEYVVFPAITICATEGYRRENRNSFQPINISNIFINASSTSFIRHFLADVRFVSKGTRPPSIKGINSKNLDFFRIPDDFDCVRLNAGLNQSVKLVTTKSTDDYFSVEFSNSFRESVSSSELNVYSFLNPSFSIYVTDNYLNSFTILQPSILNSGHEYTVTLERVSLETKLPQPYNKCTQSTSATIYHQTNCIEACISREIKDKYNCTNLATLFTIAGLDQCGSLERTIEKVFKDFCVKECHFESCYSEKFSEYHSTGEKRLDNQTVFRFAFRELNSLNITQIPKTDAFTFLNNIGGGVGLFMGIAFPNLIEFLQFAGEIFSIAFTYKY